MDLRVSLLKSGVSPTPAPEFSKRRRRGSFGLVGNADQSSDPEWRRLPFCDGARDARRGARRACRCGGNIAEIQRSVLDECLVFWIAPRGGPGANNPRRTVIPLWGFTS